MKKAILITIFGTVSSLNSFAGIAGEALKQFIKANEPSATQAMATKMSAQGLESTIALEAAVKSAPKELAFQGSGFLSLAKVSNNGQKGTIVSQAKNEQGDVINSTIQMSEASSLPTRTRIFREDKNIFLVRNFQTGIGDVEVKQGYSTFAKKTDYAYQNFYQVKTSAMDVEMHSVVSSKVDAGIAISIKLVGAKEPIQKAIMLPAGYFPWSMKINSSGTKATVMATSQSDRKSLVEFVYPISADGEKKTIEVGQAVTRTLSAAEAKQFVMEVETIAGRRSYGSPVRGMQIENSIGVKN